MGKNEAGDLIGFQVAEFHVLNGPKQSKAFCEIASPCSETNDRCQKLFLILK